MTDDREPFREARAAGLKARQERRLESATYTAAEVKVLTEAALRLGRKEAGEEIVAAIEALDGPMTGENTPSDYLAVAAGLARSIGSRPSPDATSGRTDPNSTSAMLKSLEGGNA